VPAGVRHLFGDQVAGVAAARRGLSRVSRHGLSGRIGIFEMVRMNDDLRELVLTRASEQTLLQAARQNQMSTLREQCLARVREGMTTLEEVVRVTQ